MCPPSDPTMAPSASKRSNRVHVPDSPISQVAFDHAAVILAPCILSHSIRVYVYATKLAEHTGSIYAKNPAKHDLLFTTCLFHDIATTDEYDGPQRF